MKVHKSARGRQLRFSGAVCYRFLLSMLAIATMFSMNACSFSSDDHEGDAATHTLVVRNNSSVALTFVRWVDGLGVEHSFGADDIYDATLQRFVSGISSGSSASSEVAPGSAYLHFFFADGGIEYRTASAITVRSTESTTSFELNDSSSLVPAE